MTTDCWLLWCSDYIVVLDEKQLRSQDTKWGARFVESWNLVMTWCEKEFAESLNWVHVSPICVQLLHLIAVTIIQEVKDSMESIFIK